ncbi:MAG: hypothetical protein U1A78_21340 [Polyangia bacterium]
MSVSSYRSILASLFLASACGAPAPAPGHLEQRISGQAAVDWLAPGSEVPVWLEERLAPWPALPLDRDLGPRQLVRATASAAREVVWAPPETERLTAAVAHPAGAWSAVGVDGERRPFLVRGDRSGALARITLDDPELAGDPASWIGTSPPAALRVSVLSEDSVRIGGTADEVVVSLVSEQNAVLVYRFRWDGARWQRGPRTLVSPALVQTPYLPIGASYDNFDAVVNAFSARLAVINKEGDGGGAYVALTATDSRLRRHNAVFGTRFAPLRSDETQTYRPTDLLIARIERNGAVAWTRLVGTPDVDDEVYALAAGPAGEAALVGRVRRERGRDNTEWHPTVTVLDGAGAPLTAAAFDAADSGIAQSAAFAPDGSLFVGGTEGWLQNPEGISLGKEGRPFLLRLRAHPTTGLLGVAPVRVDGVLPATRGHAELRGLAVAGGRLWLCGLERGPLTHTGDADRSLVRADGWRLSLELP